MPLQPIRRGVPTKGMNTVAPPRAMAEEFSPVLENVWYDDGITLRRRLGHSVSNATIAPNGGIKDIFEYSYGATTKRFIQDLTGLISEDTGTAYTSQAITFAGEIGHALLKDKILVGNGVANAQHYNGTAWAAPTTTPTPVGDATIGNIFHVHKGRCYAAGNTAFPMTVFISDTFTSTGVDYWGQTAGGAGELGYLLDCSGDISSGDSIIGITTHRGFLVVMCNNHVLFYNITESSTSGWSSSLYKSVKGEGCVSHKATQAVGEETIFLSPNGFKKLSVSLIQGDSQVNDLSSPINNAIKDLLNGGTVVTADIRSTYNPKYGLYICSLGSVQYAYQTQFQGWFRWTGVQSVLFTDSALVTYASGAYMCSIDNTVYQDTKAPATVTAIMMRWNPAPFRSPQLEHKPRWRKMELIYETNAVSDSVTVDYYRDMDTNMPPVNGTYTLAPKQVLENGLYSDRLELPIAGRSELVSFDFYNDQNTDFRMKLAEVYMNDGSIR